MNLNSFPSPFPIHQTNNDDHQPTFDTNYRVSSSSSSLSCRTFFDSTQDHMGYYDPHQPYHPQNEGDDKYAYCGGSSYEIKDNTESGLKLTLWKKDDDDDGHDKSISDKASPVKWMSSKMRLMKKMKRSPDRLTLKITSSATTKLEDQQQQQQQQQQETDLRRNSSYSHNNINSPVRVCADCNTTKTPLWRSGPKGPKSLCNACGIRQRKARRAMAAAAAAEAAASGTAVATSHPPPMKIKVHHHKEKSTSKNIVHAPQFKKRSKTVVTSTSASGSPVSNGQKKLGFEDFLINLSKKLAYHRVFPEDERDAAILLMALSSGLVHG